MSAVASELHVWLILSIFPLAFGLWVPLVSFLWFSYCVWFIYNQFLAVKWISGRNKVVYVTGCDTGFGLESAKALHSKGCIVFAGCLSLQSDGAQALNTMDSDRMKVLKLDIADEKSVAVAADEIEHYCRELGLAGVWGLYNNAGIALAGEIETVPMGDFERGVQINLLGPLRVTKSVLHLIRGANGRIVTITSGIARHALYGRSGYCMPKAGAEAMMDCLRYEMHKFGVKCSIISPGNFVTATRVFDNLGTYMQNLAKRIEPRVLRDYGESYFLHWAQSLISNYKQDGSGAGDMSPVVDCVLHALLSQQPRVRYQPAQWSLLCKWLFENILPSELMDVAHNYWNRSQPKPQCLNIA